MSTNSPRLPPRWFIRFAWFNHRRLHGEITDDASYTTPAEAETDHYRQPTPAVEAVTQ